MKKDKLPCEDYASHSFFELSIYTAFCIFIVSMIGHSLYMASTEHAETLHTVIIVQPWWKFWSSSHMGKDDTDQEWTTWKTTLSHVGALLIFFPVLSYICKWLFKPWALLICAIYSVTVTVYLIGMFPTLFLFMQIIFIWAAYHTNSAKVVWVVAISYIFCLNIHPLRTMKECMFQDNASQLYQGPLTSVFLAVMNLRCVSFALDRILYKVERENVFFSFLMLTAFCFYLPLLIVAPQVSSKTFRESFEKPLHSLNYGFWVNVVLQCLRYGLWFIVTDVSLYFIYQQAFALHPDIVNSMNLWALCGMGYCMFHYYQLKYIVMYGLTGFLARLDNVSAPPHPRCMARYHLYSDMWRYFDRGLYLFMRQYIYLPVQDFITDCKLSRLFASFVCFSFVFVWHGTLDSLFIWSSLNFLCLIIEGLARALSRNEKYQQYESYYLSQQAIRRLHALLASPLLMIGNLSSFYFAFGIEVGHIFVRRVIFESWPFGFFTIIFFNYCCSQISIEIKKQEMESKRKMD